MLMSNNHSDSACIVSWAVNGIERVCVNQLTFSSDLMYDSLDHQENV